MKKLLLLAASLLLIAGNIFSQAEFNTGGIIVGVSEYGAIEVYTPDGIYQLDRGSVLVAGLPDQVFDYQNDMDVEEPTVLVTNPSHSDFEIYGAYNNAYSGAPPDVIVRQYAYGWNTGAYVIIKFNIINKEASILQAMAGLDLIPYLDEEYGFDTVTYEPVEGVIRFHRGNQTNLGIQLLSGALTSLYSFEWYDDYSVDSSYWNWMHTGALQPQYVSNTADGPVTITAQEPVSLEPDASFNVYYSMAVGADEATLMSNLLAAKEAYQTLITGVEDPGNASAGLRLEQNRPNPFRDATTIRYYLPGNGAVSLKITDITGNVVAVLADGIQSQGEHSLRFDGSKLSAGVYYCTLRFNGEQQTGKLLLVK